MKFRVDEKDVKIFAIFCILLLYICAIAVLNVHSLATMGKLSGLLPFKAFTPKYLGITLVLFFLIIIGVLFSVSSHIFEREKGFGFTMQKNLEWQSLVVLKIGQMQFHFITGDQSFGHSMQYLLHASDLWSMLEVVRSRSTVKHVDQSLESTQMVSLVR